MPLDKNQDIIAMRMRCSPIGTRDLGRMSRMYGSSTGIYRSDFNLNSPPLLVSDVLRSTATKGILVKSVVLEVK